MPYRNLADFLEDLGRAGELAPVDAEVDPCLEVAEVTRRVARQNGPALLFRNVKGHDIPLVTNLFGTESRILRALGADSIEEATARIDRALNGGGSEGWLERLRFGGKSGAAASFAANKVKSGPSQQVVRLGSDVNLQDLPLSPWGPQKHPTMFSALMLSAFPETHAQILLHGNVSVLGRDLACANWSENAYPSRVVKAYRDVGGRIPLAIVVGGDPAVRLAASAPLPSSVDPIGLAGLLRERPLDAVACQTIDLQVPAEADLIIEGWIDSADVSFLGALGSLSQAQSIHVTAVTHRANHVLSKFVPSVDSSDAYNSEAFVCDRTLARIFLPYLKTRIPELVHFDMRPYSRNTGTAVLAIEKTYPTQARHVATVAWGMKPFKFARLLVIVDAETNVCDLDRVLAETAQIADWENSVFVLDGSSEVTGTVKRRIAIDATRRCARTRHVQTETLVTDRWAEYGLGPESEP